MVSDKALRDFLYIHYELEGASEQLRARLAQEVMRHMRALGQDALRLYEVSAASLLDALKAKCDETFPHIVACACEPAALHILLDRRRAAVGGYGIKGPRGRQ